MKEIAVNYPGYTTVCSLCGYFISYLDMIPDLLRLLILIASTITAISMAYIQYKKALKIKNESKKRNKR